MGLALHPPRPGAAPHLSCPRSVRVSGGAYGGFCDFDTHSGMFTYSSYRDPNLLKTVDVYDGALRGQGGGGWGRGRGMRRDGVKIGVGWGRADMWMQC